MEVKQKEFFIPLAIRIFNLFPVAGIIRETWEFVNLYSVHRGVNRFPAFVKVFELAAARKEIRERNISLPDINGLKRWIAEETRLGNENLGRYIEKNPDKDLERIYQWSVTVNKEISKWLKGIRPFPGALKCISGLSRVADTIVVSQTPLEALHREWTEHDLIKSVNLIAGQEHGTKSEHLALASAGKYEHDRVILIGDAFGDLNAAAENGVLFYPVIPGREDESWVRFNEEGLKKFLSGKFRGKYQEDLLLGFKKSLPTIPPWELKQEPPEPFVKSVTPGA